MATYITVAQLIAAGVPPTQAKQFVAPLNQFLPIYGITSKVRIAAFLAQCMHESGRFARLEEDLYYRTPERIRAVYPTRVTSLQQAATLCRNPKALANTVYANRYGNRGADDGWNYRGSGLIQVTFRDNFRAVGYENNPDDVRKPLGAVQASCRYWFNHALNVKADASDIDGITKVINPGMLGRDDRRENFRESLAALDNWSILA